MFSLQIMVELLTCNTYPLLFIYSSMLGDFPMVMVMVMDLSSGGVYNRFTQLIEKL